MNEIDKAEKVQFEYCIANSIFRIELHKDKNMISGKFCILKDDNPKNKKLEYKKQTESLLERKNKIKEINKKIDKIEFLMRK